MDAPEDRPTHVDPDLLALVALGEPTNDPASDVHLRTCALCRSQADELRAVVATGRSVTAADLPSAPPPTIWEGVARAVREDDVVPLRHRAGPARSRRPRFAIASAVAAAAAVIAVGAVVVVDPGGESGPSKVVATDVVLEPLGTSTARGVAVMVAGANGASMTVDVPDLPEGEGFYEVWLMGDDDELVSLGVLDRRNHGTFPVPDGVDPTRFPVVDVSLEHLDGDPSHSGDSVARGRLPA